MYTRVALKENEMQIKVLIIRLYSYKINLIKENTTVYKPLGTLIY